MPWCWGTALAKTPHLFYSSFHAQATGVYLLVANLHTAYFTRCSGFTLNGGSGLAHQYNLIECIVRIHRDRRVLYPLPNLLAHHPGTKDFSMLVKHHQVCMRPRSKRTFLILDSKAPAIQPLTLALPCIDSNACFAGFSVAHLIASPREHPVKRAKFRTHLSIVTTL